MGQLGPHTTRESTHDSTKTQSSRINKYTFKRQIDRLRKIVATQSWHCYYLRNSVRAPLSPPLSTHFFLAILCPNVFLLWRDHNTINKSPPSLQAHRHPHIYSQRRSPLMGLSQHWFLTSGPPGMSLDELVSSLPEFSGKPRHYSLKLPRETNKHSWETGLNSGRLLVLPSLLWIPRVASRWDPGKIGRSHLRVAVLTRVSSSRCA